MYTIEQLSKSLYDLAKDIQSLRLIGDDQPAERQQQKQKLVRMQRTADESLEGIFRELTQSPKRPYSRSETIELSRLYANAAVFVLYLQLFFSRWNAAPHWSADNGAYASLKQDILQALQIFDQMVRKRELRFTTTSYHMIATAFRAWADEFSPEANADSGWLEVAGEVARELRFRYHRFRTRELWALTWERAPKKLLVTPGNTITARTISPGITKRLRAVFHALARSIYGLIAGYGLRGGRFIITAVGIVAFFGSLYYVIDRLAECGQKSPFLMSVLQYAFLSLGTFTSLGNVSGSACQADGQIVQVVASLESVTGYFMLGILISVFWASFHEAATGRSGIRPRRSQEE